MRGALAFALLFASGLFLLVRMQSVAPAPAAPDGAQPPFAGFPPERAAPAAPSALELDGTFLLTRYARESGGTRRPLFQLEARDTATLDDGSASFDEVSAVLYDAEERTVAAVVRAREGRMLLREAGLSYPIDLKQDVAEDRIVLEDVEVELREGAPVTPLLLEVDRLEGDVAQELFTSSSMATANGPGLAARGEGLLLDLLRGVLRFDRDAVVELSDEEGGRATLRSGGKMHVLRGSGGAEVIARDGAALDLEGRDAASIRGERINVIATATRRGDADSGLRLSRLTSDGDAHVELPIGSFEAERADLQVAPRGDMRVELSGAPLATLVFAEEGSENTVELAISGEGPLLVDLAAENSFEFLGPARAEWEDNVLVSEGGLRGWAEADGGFSVTCWGGVALTQPDAWLDTTALDLRVAPGEEGDPLVQVTTGGPSHLSGTSRGGDPFVLDADQRVVYRQVGERWVVPLAIGVHLDVEAEPRLTVRAERIEDLRVDTRELLAEGSVEVLGGDRRVVGERFQSLGPEHFVLHGSASEPAHVASADLYVEGERLEQSGTTISARGSAAAELARGGGFAQVHSDSFIGSIRSERGPAGVQKTYEMWTEGGVRAVFEDAARRGESTSGTLHALLVERPVPGSAEPISDVTLELDGDVEGSWVEGPEVRRLASRSARIAYSGGPDGQSSWEATARGRVVLEGEGSASFRGTGDELTIDRLGEALLAGLDGRRVRVEGVLPGGRYPFTLEAPAARVSNERVRAEDAQLWVESLSFVPGPASRSSPVAELSVSAQNMTAVAGDLFLSGSVVVSGVDESGEEISLESGFLQFESATEGGESRPRGPSDRLSFRRMNAWGGFELRYGADLHAVGDRIEARATTGRLRVTGTPARVAFGGWVQESDFLEYDLFLRIIVRTAPGTFRPRQ